MNIGVDTTFLVEVTIQGHPGHLAARAEMRTRLSDGVMFCLAPQVISEFIHVVTDSRRFEHPLSMPLAIQLAQSWWHARETRHAIPTPASMELFFKWMRDFTLGRKRLLDTMLAATYFSHQVTTILSSDARDYTTYGCFEVISPGVS